MISFAVIKSYFLFAGMSIFAFVISLPYFELFWWQHNTTDLNPKPTEMRNVLRMLQSVDFEVFGRVQGVFFRKYTREKGKDLGLKGWAMNTSQGTVVGTMQGKEEQIEEMKHWLRTVGSPMSKIEKCVFSNERHITKEEFADFHIKY